MSKQRFYLLTSSCLLVLMILAGYAYFPGTQAPKAEASLGNIQNIIVIMMENHNWTGAASSKNLSGNTTNAPYINNKIAANALGTGWNASKATAYLNPKGNHPSLPNYLWLTMGANGGGIPATTDPSSPTIKADCFPYANSCMTWTKSYTAAHSQKPGAHQATNNNIFKLIDGTAGLSWKVYAQSYPGTSTCSLGLKNGTGGNHYAVRHNPAAYFDSETNSGSPGVSDKFCTNVKDLGTTSSGNLASDLSGGTLPNLSFVIPDTCNDMHDKCTQASTCSAQGAGTPTDNGIWNGDNFLCKWVPTILSSTQFANHGMLVIAWDEGEKTSSGTRTDGPLPFFVIGKNTNVNATTSSTRFDHSSTVRTIEQLLGLSGSGTLSLTGTNNVAKACNWHTFIVQTMASC